MQHNYSPSLLNSLGGGVPKSLHQTRGFMDFPRLAPEDLKSLQDLGWSRVGVAAIFVNPKNEILVLKHQPDGDKILGIQYGVLSETSRVLHGGNYSDSIEQPLETLLRGVKEELGINLRQINALVPTTNPWIFSQEWPVGGKHGTERIFAICSVIFVDETSAKLLVKQYRKGNKEIAAANFMTLDMIPSLPLRDGTRESLDQIYSSGLLNYSGKFKSLFESEKIEAEVI